MSFAKDLAHAARAAARAPSFTAAAVLTLALGIGANLGIFSLVYAVLVRPLPFRDAGRLVEIWETAPRMGVERNHVALPNLIDWQASSKTIERMAAVAGWSYNLTGSGDPQKLSGLMVTPDFFPMLGVDPLHGRVFPAREHSQAESRVVALSHRLWRDRFGSDPELVGRSITLNDSPFTVTAVMPVGFEYPAGSDLWVPAVFPEFLKRERGPHFLQVIARLAPGQRIEQAQAEMTTIAARLAQQYPDSNTGLGALVIPLRESFAGSLERPLWILLSAVFFVLLIACANVGNLLSLRAVGRKREAAVRTALGASWRQLTQQSLAESLVLAGAAAVVGVFLALWSFDLLKQLVPSEIAALANLQLSAPVIAFGAALTLAAGVILGLIPAIGHRGIQVIDSLKASSGTLTSERRTGRLRHILVISEVALAAVLLVGAGLMVRTLSHLYSVRLGFEPRGLLTMRTELPRPRYSESPARDEFYRQALERIRAIPGVVDAGFSSNLPLSSAGGTLSFTPEGSALSGADQPHTNYRLVTPGFVPALGLTLLEGRSFNAEDTATSPPAAIVNETLARRFWPDQNPLGRRFKVGEADSEHPWVTIVGIARDAKQAQLDEEARPELFVLHNQASTSAYFTPYDLTIRAAVAPETLAAPIRAAIWDVDATIPITAIRTMDEVVDKAAAPRRNPMIVMLCFAVLAAILAAMGIYSVISFAVAARTREIGLRIALGASGRDVVWQALRHTMVLNLCGLALGLAAALAMGRFVESLLFKVSPYDAVTFAVVAMLFLIVSTWAGYLPARRAARVDPMAALRHD